jgi:hypothetical protein
MALLVRLLGDETSFFFNWQEKKINLFIQFDVSWGEINIKSLQKMLNFPTKMFNNFQTPKS